LSRLARDLPAYFAEATLLSSRSSPPAFSKTHRLVELQLVRHDRTERAFVLDGPGRYGVAERGIRTHPLDQRRGSKGSKGGDMEPANVALLIEPTSLSTRGFGSDPDIVDFAIEKDGEVVERVQVKAPATPRTTNCILEMRRTSCAVCAPLQAAPLIC
jgi:hypothetical protein